MGCPRTPGKGEPPRASSYPEEGTPSRKEMGGPLPKFLCAELPFRNTWERLQC